jgi:hypothetical protein
MPTPLPAEAYMSAANRWQIPGSAAPPELLPRPGGRHIRATDAQRDPSLSADDRRGDDRWAMSTAVGRETEFDGKD